MTGKRLLAALAALLLLVSAVGPAVGAGVTDSGGVATALSHDDDADDDGGDWNDTEPVDDAYAAENGDVVLVYDYADDESESEDEYERETDWENVTGHTGLNVSEGLAHLTMTKSGLDANVTGDATVWAKPDSVVANGTLSAPRPEALESLDVDVSSVANATERESSMQVDAAMAIPSDAAMLGLLSEARTAGFVESTPTTLDSNGSVSVSTGFPLPTEREHHIVFTEDDGDFTLSVDEEYALQDSYYYNATEGWENRSAAKSTLESRYCADAATSAVECSVSVDSYALDESGDQPRLDIAYTVTMDGVDAAIGEAVSKGLSRPGSNVSAETAERFADHVQNVTVERVAADLVVAGGDGSLTWNVSLSGTDDLALAYADVLEIVGESATSGMPGGPETMMMGGPMSASPGEVADRLRRQVAAQRAADLQGSTTWDAVLTVESGTAVFNASMASETTNWPSYVDEVNTRGGNATADQRFTMTADTQGDRVVVDAAASYSDEAMFDRALAAYNRSYTGMETRSGDAEAVRTFFDTVEAASFQRARMDVDLTADSMTVEGALAVENASAISAEIPGPLSGIDATYTDFEDRETVLYLNGAIDGEVTEDAVRDLEFVGENTTVHTPGDWDREFDSLDTEYVRSYLGLPVDGEEGGFPVVVVGGAVAVTAAAAGGGLVLFSRFG